MKLFRKIYTQVILVFLVLSLAVFSYFICRSHKQSVSGICQYEKNIFSDKVTQFAKMLEQSQILTDSAPVRNSFAAYAFASIFADNGGLYTDGMELYNHSPYDYDYEDLLSREERSALSGEPIPQTADGHHLLLFTRQIRYGDACTFQLVYFKDISDIFLHSFHFFIQCLFFTLIILFLAGVLLFFSLRRTLLPLKDMKNTAAAIAGGDYSMRIPLPERSARNNIFHFSRQDELSELAESFNLMAEHIEDHVQALSRTNESQQQLLGSLAHELKTPMTAIIGYADTLLAVRLSDDRRAKALRYIGSECRRLSRLSSKMLELTGLTSGHSPVCLQPVKAAFLFENLTQLTTHRLSEKNIRLTCTCTPPDLTLELDSDWMMSLLINLVDNAFKASDPDSTILVCADHERLFVRDFGAGIPAEELPHITEAFYMADKSRARSMGSAGLGLTLCKQIAALHGGCLTAESTPGQGTTISVLWNHYSSVTT